MTASPATSATGSQSGVRKTRRPLGGAFAATTTGLASGLVRGPAGTLAALVLDSCGAVAVFVWRRAIRISLQVRSSCLWNAVAGSHEDTDQEPPDHQLSGFAPQVGHSDDHRNL